MTEEEFTSVFERAGITSFPLHAHVHFANDSIAQQLVSYILKLEEKLNEI